VSSLKLPSLPVEADIGIDYHPFTGAHMKFMHQSLTVAVLITTAQLSGLAFAQTGAVAITPKTDRVQIPQLRSMAAANTTDPLAGGAEIFENFTEASPLMNAAAFNESMAKFETLYPDISARLSPDRKKRLDSLVSGIRRAWRKGDRGPMAVESIEIYRLLEESIDHNGQPVPVEVPMLDYSGFKLKALLLSTHPDWKQVRKTAQEASMWWAAIKTKVTDNSLRDAMAHTIRGIKEAGNLKDPKLLGFTAEMDLILVDGLEAFFNSHVPGR